MADNLRLARRFDVAVRRLVPAFRREVRVEKNRFIDSQIKNYRQTGMLNRDLLVVHQSNMQDIFERHYRLSIQVGIDVSTAMFAQKAGPVAEHKFDYVNLLMMDWMTQWGGSRIKETAETTFDDLNRLIAAAFSDGRPEHEIIKQALRAKGLSLFRADTIARTETHQAAMYASQNNVERMAANTGVTVLKKWQPVADERTRISHAAMSGKEAIAMGAKFLVGGERMERPGDPNASASNTINCRCVLIYEFPD